MIRSRFTVFPSFTYWHYYKTVKICRWYRTCYWHNLARFPSKSGDGIGNRSKKNNNSGVSLCVYICRYVVPLSHVPVLFHPFDPWDCLSLPLFESLSQSESVYVCLSGEGLVSSGYSDTAVATSRRPRAGLVSVVVYLIEGMLKHWNKPPECSLTSVPGSDCDHQTGYLFTPPSLYQPRP